MDPGRKSRDQPRKEKLKTSKQRTDIRLQSTPQPKRNNFITSLRDTEYVESSHPSVLARGPTTATWSRYRDEDQPRSKRNSGDRRPCTPVPSLISSDAMSPPSINTISPTTPVFDTALSRPSTTRSSHNRHPTPLDFDGTSRKRNQSLPKPRNYQSDFDPASTYQPRRLPITQALHGASQRTNPAPIEETSFIEWDDDDPSRLQRMKQSLTFTRPHRPVKTNLIQSQNPDRQLNAVPRVVRAPRSPPQPTSPTYTYTSAPQPRSPTYNISQQRPLPICVPASSAEQVRYLPSNIPPYQAQPSHPHPHPPPQTRYPEANSGIPHHILTTTQYQLPLHIRQDLPRPSYISERQPMRSPVYSDHDEDRASTSHSEAYGDENAPKPNRFKEIMRGVAKKASMRDMRKKPAGAGAGAKK